MSEFFEKHAAFFADELRKQVDLLWPREAACLEGHGLREAKSVLDLGTGNGYFLYRLAQRYPDKDFTGIESSPSLTAVARRPAAEGQAPNMRVLEGSCPLPDLTDRFDLIHARLALYSMPNREEVLRWAKSLLKDGGRIVIMDVDDSLKTTVPSSSFWEPLVSGMAKEIGPGADRQIGRKLPLLLQQAGFSDIRLEVRPWFSTFDLGKPAFGEFWSTAAKQMAGDNPDIFGPKGLAPVLAAIDDMVGSKDKVALSLTCIASAAK